LLDGAALFYNRLISSNMDLVISLIAHDNLLPSLYHIMPFCILNCES
jgi:hypothetical protein